MVPAIGLQLFSVRNSLQEDYVLTLEKIAEIGYRNLELITAGTPDGLVFGQGLPAAQLRKHLDRLGLRAVSCHFVPFPGLRLEPFLADLQLLGVDSLVCAIAFFTCPQDVQQFSQTFNHAADVCKQHGVQLYYHNHFHEFQVFDGKSVFEMMLEQLKDDLVMFEFDTYWAARAGQDPIYWLKKLGQRCDLLHQKDLPAHASPVNLFERLGYDSKLTMDALIGIQDPGYFTEVGEGMLNIPGIIQACRTYNQARYIFVEQDLTSRPELESIAVSFTNLGRLLAA